LKDLPHFSIRESPKAKRVILKISARHGLEVVIPRGFDRKQLPRIIHEKRAWIEQALRKINHPATVSAQPQKLPEAIHFKAVNLEFQVEYVPVAVPFLELIHLNQSRLRMSGKISDPQGCRDLLKRWLQHQGRVHLIPWLARVSSEIGLPYQKAQIRGQKSRWGSCSNRGTISLNYNLLFLRPELVHCLIIHELCHTVHLNHAAEFYRLHGQFVPDYRELRAEMKHARDQVPWWAK
jgi:predicted metal-dependent hydrolase